MNKDATLLALAASSYGNGRTIVFFRTKVAAHRAKLLFGLEKLPPAAELHGNMSQTGRLEALDAFRKVLPHVDSHLPGCHVSGVPVWCSSAWLLPGTQPLDVQTAALQGDAAFLLATDVAARGLDISGVENVINYDAPPTVVRSLWTTGAWPPGVAYARMDVKAVRLLTMSSQSQSNWFGTHGLLVNPFGPCRVLQETYLHRIGRTARAGAAGRALTFVEDQDRALLKQVLCCSDACLVGGAPR